MLLLRKKYLVEFVILMVEIWNFTRIIKVIYQFILNYMKLWEKLFTIIFNECIL